MCTKKVLKVVEESAVEKVCYNAVLEIVIRMCGYLCHKYVNSILDICYVP